MATRRGPRYRPIRKMNKRQQKRGLRQARQGFSMKDYLNLELLRFTTAGSVDDGKSTLIGRLLYDSKAIFQDQMEALEQSRKLRGDNQVNLALLTDGLRAEREQGITIDVAYRYFSTPRRKFIIADTPGHEQYTRNMVTGASTADLAIILIDARKGVLTQSRRHGFIASLLGIPHLLVAVNKMDLVDWSQSVFQKIVDEYTAFSEKLNIRDIDFIPISALTGDNVVKKSKKMRWHEGISVLQYLEHITIAADRNLQDFRFPVQYVIRPDQNFRGFSGRVASGTIQVGDEVASLPSLRTSKVKTIHTYEKELRETFQGQSVVIVLEDEIDVSRGDMLVRKASLPIKSHVLETIICWMDDNSELSVGMRYTLKHTTRTLSAAISKLHYRININTLHREQTTTLALNEIGRVEIETAYPLFFDSYNDNRITGSFILIEPISNLTVAAGIIRHEARTTQNATEDDYASHNLRWERPTIDISARIARNGHRPLIVWFTGLSGSGKTTLGQELERRLFAAKMQVCLLDGDNLRHGLNSDLEFSEEDRAENIRRAAHSAELLYNAGFVVICAFISPRKVMRDMARSLFPDGRFKEIYVKVELEHAKQRDPKGLYKKVSAGEIHNFTSIHQPYEVNEDADLIIDTQMLNIEESVEKILHLILPDL